MAEEDEEEEEGGGGGGGGGETVVEGEEVLEAIESEYREVGGS
jgi:hypothetical protein